MNMKVQEIMRERVETCVANNNLAAAAAIMWNADCGVLPIVADGRKVIGVLTDRDIAIAVGTRQKNAAEITISEVMSKNVHSCSPDDDIHAALKTMRKEKVRRLPVVNEEGALEGILSMNDVALHAENFNGHKTTALSYEDVVNTLKAVCEHRHLVETKKQKAAS
jgi:CBS domain-containing protein